MVCTSCPDLQTEISNCAPYANRTDVISLMTQMMDSCCVGEPISTFKNPSESDAQAALIVSEAFPDGASSCHCPCKYIVDQTNDKLYVNCTNSLNLAENWHELGAGGCHGRLTTVNLDPSLNPATSILEAFPHGLSVHCESLTIIREDGVPCFSNDGGTSFSCVKSFEGSMATIRISGNTALRASGSWLAVGVGGSGSQDIISDPDGIISSLASDGAVVALNGLYVVTFRFEQVTDTGANNNTMIRLANATQATNGKPIASTYLAATSMSEGHFGQDVISAVANDKIQWQTQSDANHQFIDRNGGAAGATLYGEKTVSFVYTIERIAG